MQICDAERHAMHSDAGASGTIISTIVRRSASHAALDAPRPVLMYGAMQACDADVTIGMQREHRER
ncbi:Unknown protein sequence [Pseudomonas amygdali pv. myricae]|nr:Unknown protein sequence [Pseudomonas amygdali pv. myricae]KWS45978.1 hypothetical protein AL057_07245 [Pseudomonas amygdali pv. myricae]